MYTGAMTESNIMDYWPFPYPPRQNQEIALPWLAANQDKRYLILEAPVGAGKSNIGLVYSLFRGSNAFVLTPQRILQEQYEESFQTTPEIDLASHSRRHLKLTLRRFTANQIINAIRRTLIVPLVHWLSLVAKTVLTTMLVTRQNLVITQ
jgi:superfamily II DNA or RNA helicase